MEIFQDWNRRWFNWPKNNKKLIAFPSLCEPLLRHLDRMLPKGEQFHRGHESISIFTDDNIMTVNSFGALNE